VLFVNNKFSNGQFTQTLQTIRRPRQDDNNLAPATNALVNTDNAGGQITKTPSNPVVGASSEGTAGEAAARANVNGASNPPYDDAILRQARAASKPNPAAGSTYDDAPLRALRAKQAANISVQQQSGPF
jgi:hypothetical protein